MPGIRLGFDVDAVENVDGGWRLEGTPDFHPRHWPRAGDRLDRYTRTFHDVKAVDLIVVEVSAEYVVVAGTGGELLRGAGSLSGARTADPTGEAPSLAEIFGLDPARDAFEWSEIESALGVTLPSDYKRFTGTHGAHTVDDHLLLLREDILEENEWARECVRLDFGGPGTDYTEPWSLGDASRWTADRADVPEWFAPGDDLVLWGLTGNSDLLLWHVRPGAAPDDWPVVLKERGPLWERFEGGFDATLSGLLTGDLQSGYLSRRFGGPHSYR
ncbi:SMI1/KNR4 family protein [Actinoplanes lobatus]|nr:SMI1/KNR4 family protein [Actinoplanes lobatus]MBB4754247.1 hypothetical protein [Actinoplanes lobatus]